MRAPTLLPICSASDPGGFHLSHAKLRKLSPTLYKKSFWNYVWDIIHFSFGQPYPVSCLEDQLKMGDSRAAMVVSLAPLVVACYSDEFDSVIPIRYPDYLVQEYKLVLGSRLVSCWLYLPGNHVVKDTMVGPKAHTSFAMGLPVVADFFVVDMYRLGKRKEAISDMEWRRCDDASREYAQHFGRIARFGLPPTRDKQCRLAEKF